MFKTFPQCSIYILILLFKFFSISLPRGPFNLISEPPQYGKLGSGYVFVPVAAKGRCGVKPSSLCAAERPFSSTAHCDFPLILQFSTVFIKLTQQNSFTWDSQQIYAARTSTFPLPCDAICVSLTPVLGISQKAEEEMMPPYYPSSQRGARNICAALSKHCLSPAETRVCPKEAPPAHTCRTTAKTEATLQTWSRTYRNSTQQFREITMVF